ncbi:FkbM family methyltransferase [Eikenella sp. S3360]|uniref:FkbM family methyltransferase n=1 Tax=Eikenella glucosivorans TaxID=2766967 RepID=A0ABS0NC82_9NEIS|nr:FkbM family methyltransferase [Eikenella glucosivorans]MBH5329925.1 FkbM family methyltransferase [Eikenella glucosivorans]
MLPLCARIVTAFIPNQTLRHQIRDILLGRNNWEIRKPLNLQEEEGFGWLTEVMPRLPLHELVKNYSAIGELLAILRPYDCIGVEKIRTGNKNDGGYVMLNPNDAEKIAYSFGVSPESPWDLEMAEKGLKVYQYDGTIDTPPDLHSNLFFHKNNISAPSNSTEHTKNIGQIFNDLNHQNEQNIILQIDIEGAEWSVFEELQEDEILKFSQIIIEWHDLTPLDPEFQRRLEILRKVSKTHTPIHVHMNNYGLERNTRAGMLFYADAFEVSYVRTKDFNFKPNLEFYPTPLDNPCNPKWPDIPIGKWSEK